LRFSEFNKPWDKYKLKDISKRITRKNINNTSKLPLTISAQFGLINQEEFFDKQIASRDMSNYYLIQNGEFAYNKSYSNGYPWGAIKRLDKYDNGALSTLYICFKPNDNICSDYLTHYFETTKWYKGISDIAGEGARNHGLLNMSVDDFFDTKHYLPDIQEQVKIKDFLNLISRKVDTQSKIIKELKFYKNIISDKLLYSDKTIEYNKLSSLAKLKNGYAFKSSEYETNGEFNIITIANVTGERYINTENCNKVNYLPTDIQKHQQLKNNDILISLTGNVGRVSMCNQNNCLLNQRVGLLEIKDSNLIEYVYQCLANKHFEKEMNSKGQGAAQLNIGKDDIENYKIPICQKEKKNKICCLLKSLDKKIAIEEKILNDYQLMKKYLLSNMFI